MHVPFLILTPISIALAATSSASGPVVDLDQVHYEGIANDTTQTNTFWALRYAQPPTGDERFRAPSPIANESGLINATAPGPQCIQGTPAWYAGLTKLATLFPPSTISSSEDCLTLDVIVPQKARSSALPVVVQIHGGGYTQGNSQSSDGHYFVQHSNGSVVYVQIQYRLGMYGFLGSSDVLEDGDANVGLLDQRLALNWVQKNIRAFGGDPSKVTIWGGSAGGGSVTNQLILYGGERDAPFRGAIPEYPWWQPFHDKSVLEYQYRSLLEATQCSDLPCIRALSEASLANASAATYIKGYEQGVYGYGDYYYGPFVDGQVIRDLPSQEFKQGHWSKVPILTDREAFEGAGFTNFSITTEPEASKDLHTLWPTASEPFFTRLNSLYPLSTINSLFQDPFFKTPIFQGLSALVNLTIAQVPYFQLQARFGDAFINCPTYYLSTAAAAAHMPVWKLQFRAGTYLHGSTMPYLFQPDNATGFGAGNATAIGPVMKDYFLAFITDLDPNSVNGSDAGSPVRPHWPMYYQESKQAFEILQINETAIGVREDEDASPRCDFLHGQSYAVRN